MLTYRKKCLLKAPPIKTAIEEITLIAEKDKNGGS
jgi:hypothetical protein